MAMKFKPWHFLLAGTVALAALAGCSTLDEKQRGWIFRPSDRTWGGLTADGMDEVWISFDSKATGQPAKLNALWLAADEKPGRRTATKAAGVTEPPLLLYLHGSGWNVVASTPRMKRMQELGFSVLAIDYRGFGKSTAGLPSEATAYEDARAAWDWLGQQYPGRARYIFGHSLGGAIAIDLAAAVKDEAGVIVEGTFTSIPDVAASSAEWGWLPVGPLITQRFDSMSKVAKIGSPLLVVHGDSDRLIQPSLAKKLYEAATGKKQFVLVEGGSHHSTMAVGYGQYKEALAELFSLK